MMPSWPSASAPSRNACAAARSLVDEPRHVQRGRHDAREPLEPLGERPVDEILAVRVQAIEAEQRQRQRVLELARRRACGRTGASCPGTAARGRPRASARALRRRGSRRAPATRRSALSISGTLAVTSRPVRENTRTPAVAFVDLHARAVELVLEHGRRERGERARRRPRRAREHRRQRLVERQPKPLEPGAACLERGARDGRQAARQHDGAAHVGRRDLGGRRNRFGHDAFERALPQLAEQEAREELLLAAPSRRRASASSACSRRGAEPLPAIARSASSSRAAAPIVRRRRARRRPPAPHGPLPAPG